MNMKRVAWALMVVGMFVAGSSVLAEAADGPGGGAHRGGSGWQAGSPRGGGGSHVRHPRVGSARHPGGSWRGSRWHTGSHWHHGSFHSGGWRWHGGTRVFIGRPGWWGPGWWGAPYPYYVAPPVVVQPPPTAYIQQEPAPSTETYWYYCQDAGAYYPYVKECPGGWTQVVPQPAPPSQ